MNDWRVVYSRQAQKDAKKLSSSGLKPKAQKLLAVLQENPCMVPPRYEKLVGCDSRRITIQHRLGLRSPRRRTRRARLTYVVALRVNYFSSSTPPTSDNDDPWPGSVHRQRNRDHEDRSQNRNTQNCSSFHVLTFRRREFQTAPDLHGFRLHCKAFRRPLVSVL